MAAQLIVHPQQAPLRGSIPVVGDQSVALCRMALGALSRGNTSLTFSGPQGSIVAFVKLLSAFGIRCEHQEGAVRIFGAGLEGLSASNEALDLRGDVEVAALALGLLVSRPFDSELLVDDVVAELLVPVLAEAHDIREKSAEDGGRLVFVGKKAGEGRAPGLSVALLGVYPWVKQAILLAGLRAGEATVVEERFASADHLERAMTRARMPIDVQGTVATLHPPRDLDAVAPQIYDPIGSVSMTTALFTAALMQRGSAITVREVATNPTRVDCLSVFKLYGANVGVTPLGDRQGEPFGELSIRAAALRGVNVSGETALRLRDDIVPLLAASAMASGQSTFSDLVAEKRGGDSRIWGRAVGLLRSAGVDAEVNDGTLCILGSDGNSLKGLRVTTGGDSRLAVLATLLALGAGEKSVIDDVDCLTADYPRWFGSLKALGAQVELAHVS